MKLRFELLEPRHMLASVSGMVVDDLNGDHLVGPEDQPIRNALVWLDTNNNAQVDANEPRAVTDGSGKYAFEGLAPGDYQLRYLPDPGYFQTAPYQYLVLQKADSEAFYAIANLNLAAGSIELLTPANVPYEFALIKTNAGDYYLAGHLSDALTRIDPITGLATRFPASGKELVAGLAYDFIMDEIFVLANESPTAILQELNIFDRESGMLSRVSNEHPGIEGIQFTTSLAFDWVNREIVLFDNFDDTFYSFDLQGNARRLATLQSHTPFFNLVFDGYRFLASRLEGNQTVIVELEPMTGVERELQRIEGQIGIDAADLHAAFVPHRLTVSAVDEVFAGVDFLAGQIDFPSAVLDVAESSANLSSTAKRLSIDFEITPDLETISLGRGATELTLRQSIATPDTVRVDLGWGDDVLIVNELPRLPIDFGAGMDTLRIEDAVNWNLSYPTPQISGLEVIDHRSAAVMNLRVTPSGVQQLNGENRLQVLLSENDVIHFEGAQWSLQDPLVRPNGTRVHQWNAAPVVVEVENGFGWQNPQDYLDVNHDGAIAPIDVLIIINAINNEGAGPLTGNPIWSSAAYLDTSGDNYLSPRDAILVLNFLNRSEPGLIAYEGFDYAASAELIGQSGGRGFSSDWYAGGFNATVHNELEIQSESLKFGMLPSSGNNAMSPVCTSGICGLVRDLDASLDQDGTTRYLSFLLEPKATDYWFGMTLESPTEPELFVGFAWEDYSWVLEDRGGSRRHLSSTPVVLNQTALLVVKAEFRTGIDRFTLYIDPSTNGAEPVRAGLVKEDVDVGLVTGLGIYSR
ncbi:MAG TPA: SdrD B-like domain-containing protein, partial [Pirellulaceae bacterium]|nr:SdrD B-like domain-containing protein [Pirellulaceae bacterium]